MGNSPAAPIYLDDNGNPQSTPVYLDDNGNPQSAQQAQQPSALTRLWQGAVGQVKGAYNSVASAIAPPQDAKEEVANAIGGPGALTAYRAARKVTDGVEGVFKGKTEQYDALKQDAVQAISELHNGDWRNGVTDTASAAAGIQGLTGSADLGTRSRELIQGTKPGGDLATPIGKTIGDAAVAAVAEGAGRAAGVSGAPESSEAPAAVTDAGPGILQRVKDATSTLVKNPAPEVQQGIANIAKDTGEATGDITPTAADPYGFRQVAQQQVGRYKEAANKLDELSDNAFSDAQEAVADSRDDFTAAGKQAYRQAVQKLNSIIDTHASDLADEGIDVSAMKTDYQAAMANQKIASFLNKTTEEVGTDAPQAQAKLGSGLKEALLDLVQNQKGLLDKAGWTSDHINQAMQFARKMDTAQTARTAAKWAAGAVPVMGAGYETARHLLP
jgi:flagellar biosynthesis chaperone FliJ